MNDLGLLQKYKFVEFKNIIKSQGKHSRLKIYFVVSFATVFWIALFFIFKGSFRYFGNDLKIWNLVAPFMFSMFFFILSMMLVFSSGVLSYATLYKEPQAQFLLACPVRPENAFMSKFIEITFFSSWASVYLSTPLITAYGVMNPTPWYYYIMGFAMLIPFIIIMSALGTIFIMFLNTFFASNRRVVLVFLLIVIIVATSYIVLDLYEVRGQTARYTQLWFKKITVRLEFAQSDLLPSYWMSQGMLQASVAEMESSFFYFNLLMANALFLVMICYWFAAKFYIDGWSAAHASIFRRKYSVKGILDGLAEAFIFLPSKHRKLLAKDFKSFFRDPVQWLQTLIFFGILAVYIFNLRNLEYHMKNFIWKTWIQNLNLASASFTLATFTSRFIYPSLSLEGKRFWSLGILPLKRSSIVVSKFVFSVAMGILVCVPLIFVSGKMLNMRPNIIVLHMFISLLVCSGLSGLAVGMGAIYVDLKSSNPAKIISGFGGTLNLIMSLAFVTIMIFMQYRLTMSAGYGNWYSSYRLPLILLTIAIAFSATFIPLLMGIKKYRNLEF